VVEWAGEGWVGVLHRAGVTAGNGGRHAGSGRREEDGPRFRGPEGRARGEGASRRRNEGEVAGQRRGTGVAMDDDRPGRRGERTTGRGARCQGGAVSCKPWARQWFWLGHSQVAGQLAAPAYGPAGRHGAGKERRERGSMAFS
jgi:hypothetical protein